MGISFGRHKYRQPTKFDFIFSVTRYSPNNACVVGFLLFMYISWLRPRDFWSSVAVLGCGWRILSPVAGCGWELRAPVAGCGCGWSALVQMRCLWLGLECGCVYSLGSCRACLHNASCDCLHVCFSMLTWLLACIAAWLPTDDVR